MTEIPQERLVHRFEYPTHLSWKIENPSAVSELADVLARRRLMLPDPLVAMRGGGIMAPLTTEIAPGYKKFLASERPFAVVPVMAEPGGRLEQVVHFPTRKEPIRYDANLASYKQFVGDYVNAHWNNQTEGPPPLTKTMVERLEDGRFVTIDKYRPYLRGLGKGSGSLGTHELDTKRITLEETKQLVQLLDRIHPHVEDFRVWLTKKGGVLPEESLLHPENPLTVLRGQEWWIDTSAPMDRLRELTAKASALTREFAAIDPTFSAGAAIERMIKNNLEIFPHQNGQGSPEQKSQLVVTHGALYPDNISRSTTREGQTMFTVTGGDRAHIGTPAEAVDWLIAASAESPEHQQTLIETFLTLHPGETEKRALAMHVLYRSIMEASWFAKDKPNELKNLASLSYNILQGRGVWQGVTTPFAHK